MKITQAFTREEENREIYDKLNRKCYTTWMKAQYTSNLVWYSVDNISTWVVGAMYLIGLYMLGPAMKIGTLIAISSYAWRFWQPILNLSNLYNTFINAVAYLERIFEMIDEPVTVDDAPGATDLPPHHRPGHLRRRDLLLRRPGEHPGALQPGRTARGVHRPGRAHRRRQNHGGQPDLPGSTTSTRARCC